MNNKPKISLNKKEEVANKEEASKSEEMAKQKKDTSSTLPAVDPEKLSELIKCLTKTRGVNKDNIDADIVAKTIEFGQQKVAQDLNIPYRRYKSILNKVGIKTNAGRKVQNFKLEAKLVEWALSVKSSSGLLTRKMIQDKGSEFIHQLTLEGDKSVEKVRLSKGWLDKFVKRHEDIKQYLTSQKGKKGL